MSTSPTTERLTPDSDHQRPEPPGPTEAEKESRKRAAQRLLTIGVLTIVILQLWLLTAP